MCAVIICYHLSTVVCNTYIYIYICIYIHIMCIHLSLPLSLSIYIYIHIFSIKRSLGPLAASGSTLLVYGTNMH